MEFYANGKDVFKKTSAGDVRIATVNSAMLTPKAIAEDIAAALNEKFNSSKK